ncbi:hypothetical protein CB1_001402045 [Camelus ferus]|nr:hypothetical protein CB1_001402045 [Camelus ferus]
MGDQQLYKTNHVAHSGENLFYQQPPLGVHGGLNHNYGNTVPGAGMDAPQASPISPHFPQDTRDGLGLPVGSKNLGQVDTSRQGGWGGHAGPGNHVQLRGNLTNSNMMWGAPAQAEPTDGYQYTYSQASEIRTQKLTSGVLHKLDSFTQVFANQNLRIQVNNMAQVLHTQSAVMDGAPDSALRQLLSQKPVEPAAPALPSRYQQVPQQPHPGFTGGLSKPALQIPQYYQSQPMMQHLQEPQQPQMHLQPPSYHRDPHQYTPEQAHAVQLIQLGSMPQYYYQEPQQPYGHPLYQQSHLPQHQQHEDSQPKTYPSDRQAQAMLSSHGDLGPPDTGMGDPASSDLNRVGSALPHRPLLSPSGIHLNNMGPQHQQLSPSAMWPQDSSHQKHVCSLSFFWCPAWLKIRCIYLMAERSQGPRSQGVFGEQLDAKNKLTCSICLKEFKSLPALNGHMRSHGGMRASPSLKQLLPPKPSSQGFANSVAAAPSARDKPASLMSDDEMPVLTLGMSSKTKVFSPVNPPDSIDGSNVTVTPGPGEQTIDVEPVSPQSSGRSSSQRKGYARNLRITLRINIGLRFQAEIPELQDVSALAQDTHKATLVWKPWPELENHDLQQRVENLLNLCCSSALPGGGTNSEFALHSLFEAKGDVMAALEMLLLRKPVRLKCHPLANYHYADPKEGVIAVALVLSNPNQGALPSHLSAPSTRVKSKTVAQCVEYYYTWKKIMRLGRKHRTRLAEIIDDCVDCRCHVTPFLPQVFSSRQALNGHARIHGGTNQVTKARGAVPSGKQKPGSAQSGYCSVKSSPSHSTTSGETDPTTIFPCKECGKVFFKIKSRNAHMKTHRQQEEQQRQKAQKAAFAAEMAATIERTTGPVGPPGLLPLDQPSLTKPIKDVDILDDEVVQQLGGVMEEAEVVDTGLLLDDQDSVLLQGDTEL